MVQLQIVNKCLTYSRWFSRWSHYFPKLWVQPEFVTWSMVYVVIYYIRIHHQTWAYQALAHPFGFRREADDITAMQRIISEWVIWGCLSYYVWHHLVCAVLFPDTFYLQTRCFSISGPLVLAYIRRSWQAMRAFFQVINQYHIQVPEIGLKSYNEACHVITESSV